MKLSEQQIKERHEKAQAEAEQKEQEHQDWFKRQGFLTKTDRAFFVSKLRDSQSNLAVAWEQYRDDSFKEAKKRIAFTIEIEQTISSKIGDILIKNKFPL